MKNRQALTAKQKLFALEYLKDLNATQAAIRAGYSRKGAAMVGCNLSRNIKVTAETLEAMDQCCEKLELKAEDTTRAIEVDNEDAAAIHTVEAAVASLCQCLSLSADTPSIFRQFGLNEPDRRW